VIEFAQIRKMSDRELEDALKQAKQDLWGARFALSTRQLADTSTIPKHRHTIARILTVQRERSEGGSAPVGKAAASASAPAAAAPKTATTKRTKR
jgi:ribosomal protein L29